ncbi:nucleotide sugar dehydrogenase [Corynebacterium pacaense]|uniref:nucleotide sugar dehydrogenase n=1 Tax=Corynebacterium pacaense TaxID=1816684 RepID=UPI002481E3FD|nr:nucleotide sugar dehydrogenase [Corynebacterium pacaense]
MGIIGLGYVGLPTAISLADKGHSVIGYDLSPSRIGAILGGNVDLSDAKREMLRRFLDSGQIQVSTDPEGLVDASAIIICVPTPINRHRVPDLDALNSSIETVLSVVHPGQTIILTSTTYVGCTRSMIADRLTDRGFTVGKDVFVAFSPERINPGVVENEPMKTPRVLGGVTAQCSEAAMETIRDTASMVHVVSSPEVAEMTKLLENTFRAVNIAFINEFSDAAEHYGVPISEVIEAASTKPYGFMKFTPGPGVGGHCIPCDPEYLLWGLKAEHARAPITETVMNEIAERPMRVVQSIQNVLGANGRSLHDSWIHMAGVAFKPNVADVRESPALVIIEELIRRGARVTYSDTHVDSVRVNGGYIDASPASIAEGADLVVVHTLHEGETVGGWESINSRVFDATFSSKVTV